MNHEEILEQFRQGVIQKLDDALHSERVHQTAETAAGICEVFADDGKERLQAGMEDEIQKKLASYQIAVGRSVEDFFCNTYIARAIAILKEELRKQGFEISAYERFGQGDSQKGSPDIAIGKIEYKGFLMFHENTAGTYRIRNFEDGAFIIKDNGNAEAFLQMLEKEKMRIDALSLAQTVFHLVSERPEQEASGARQDLMSLQNFYLQYSYLLGFSEEDAMQKWEDTFNEKLAADGFPKSWGARCGSLEDSFEAALKEEVSEVFSEIPEFEGCLSVKTFSNGRGSFPSADGFSFHVTILFDGTEHTMKTLPDLANFVFREFQEAKPKPAGQKDMEI